MDGLHAPANSRAEPNLVSFDIARHLQRLDSHLAVDQQAHEHRDRDEAGGNP